MGFSADDFAARRKRVLAELDGSALVLDSRTNAPGGRYRADSELFYLTDAGGMGVTVETGAGFQVRPPTLIIEGSHYGPSGSFHGRTYDVAPDGERFVMLREEAVDNTGDPLASTPQITVVLNWFEELKARVPVN